jgi:hypothetical protein
MFRNMLRTGLMALAVLACASQGSFADSSNIQPNSRLRPPRYGYYWPQYGLRVMGVTPGSPAWRQGLQPGDVIASVNGHPVPTLQDLHYWIGTAPNAAQLQVIDRNTGRLVWVAVYPINGLIGVNVQPTLLPGYGPYPPPYYPPIGQPNQGTSPLQPSMPPMPALPSIPTIGTSHLSNR